MSDFHSVLDGVEQRYARLLNAREHAAIARIRGLSTPAQQLYARLVNRKGPYFRVARLRYPEIGGLDAPIAELAAQGLLETAAPLTRREQMLACFTLPELTAGLGALAPKAARRAALLEWLGQWEQCGAWMDGLLAEHRLVGVPEADPWPFLRFLFFGELRPNLADFVTRALGRIVTESFDGEHLRPLFASRAEADDAYRMARLYAAFAEMRKMRPAAALLDWWRAQGIERDRLLAGHAWFDRLVDRLGRRLEREKAPGALALYETSPVAPARERAARLLLKAGEPRRAMEILRRMAAAPCDPREAYAARQLLARLEQKSRRGEARQLQLESRSLTLPYAPRSAGAPAMTVEAAVLAYYRAQGWQGVHAENWLWNASFGLLLWDIIYDPALGVFHSPLQYAPADLYTPEFYRRRQPAIEARLGLLQQPLQALAVIETHIRAKQGLANPFVASHEALGDILSVLLHRVPPLGHAAVLRRMAGNLSRHANGFLDLFIWNEQDYRFIEIKSENDQLAAHQYEWLRYFIAAGINVSLERVRRPAQSEINMGVNRIADSN